MEHAQVGDFVRVKRDDPFTPNMFGVVTARWSESREFSLKNGGKSSYTENKVEIAEIHITGGGYTLNEVDLHRSDVETIRRWFGRVNK